MGKYLITGGAGFIGMAMAKRLLGDGHNVYVIDKDKCEQYLDQDQSKIHRYQGDISNENTMSIVPDIKYDCVFHMAAQTSARISEESPELDMDSNLKGTYYVCKWIRENRPKRAVFTSSMAVYGAHGDNIDESYERNPVSVYGITKRSGEDFFRVLHTEGINVTVYRLFNVYGPGQDYTNLKQGMLSIFLTQALTSDAIRVTGRLDRYRDFVYIDDVLNALLIDDSNDKNLKVYNVGNGKAVTVKELCHLILQSTKK